MSPPVVSERSIAFELSVELEGPALVSVAAAPESEVAVELPSPEEASCQSSDVLSSELVPVDESSDSFIVCPASELEGRLPASESGLGRFGNDGRSPVHAVTIPSARELARTVTHSRVMVTVELTTGDRIKQGVTRSCYSQVETAEPLWVTSIQSTLGGQSWLNSMFVPVTAMFSNIRLSDIRVSVPYEIMKLPEL